MKKMVNPQIKLAKLESEIESGIRTVGRALTVIQSQQLYKSTYDTFEKYCKERWGFGRDYAYKLIKAEAFVTRVSSIVDKVPTVEGQVREVLKAPESKQAEIVAAVQEKCEAEKREPTAKDYRAAVKPFIEPKNNKPEPKPEKQSEPEPTAGASIVQDRNGLDIPENLRSAYQMRLAWESVISELRAIKRKASKLSKQVGGEYINGSTLNTNLQDVINSIALSVFGEVCQECEGNGCKFCQELGFQPERFGKQ